MSHVELKTFEWSCDGCHKRTTGMGASALSCRPTDWKRTEIHDCGMTGYTVTRDICADCAMKMGI